MKITDSEVIKAGERELIDTIIGDLDWGAIEKIFKEKHHLRIQDDVEYRQGDLVVHNDQVAYRLDFDVKLTISIFLDRAGNYVSVAAQDETLEAESETIPPETAVPDEESEKAVASTAAFDAAEPDRDAGPGNAPAEKMTRMASQIADMISEINEDE